MTVFPVIERELRAAGRQAYTYYLRLLGVGALLVSIVLFVMDQGLEAHSGGALFASLHVILFWSIWIIAPWLTADCISRERRERTLGLLFLTRLRGADIVMAKSVAQGMRALTIWVAVVPVLAIPLLLGGVGWREVVLSVVFNFEALCCALAAGLLASAWSTAWLRAQTLAVILAIGFLVVSGLVTGWVLMDLVGPRLFGPRGVQLAPWAANPTPYFLMAGIGFPGSSPLRWSQLLILAPKGQFLWTLGIIAFGSLLVMAGAILIAGRKTRRSWQQEPASARRLWVQAKFCTPVLWLSFFRRWMRRKLERNPIGWLEQRTWTGRTVTWAWFGIIIALFSAALDDPHFLGEYHDLHTKIAWLLAGSIAVSAAASFRRERMSGMLELLLISPLREVEILWGRLRGLWGQFFPTVALLLAIWVYFLSLQTSESGEGKDILFFISTFLTLPVVGLYFSLRCRNFIAGFLWSLAVGLLLPIVFGTLLWLIWAFFSPPEDYEAAEVLVSVRASFAQLAFTGLLWWRMERRLRTRRFPLERTAQ